MKMTNYSGNPRADWGYGMITANFILNDVPTAANDNLTPNQVWGDNRSRLPMPAPWGCLCAAHVYKKRKMETKAKLCAFMGMNDEY